MYKVGDIVIANEFVLKIEPYLEGSKFEVIEININNRSLLVKTIETKTSIYPLDYICHFAFEEIRLFSNKTQKCTCEIKTLMHKGCQCGGE